MYLLKHAVCIFQVFVLLITFMLVLFKFAMVLAYSQPGEDVARTITQQSELTSLFNRTTPLPSA